MLGPVSSEAQTFCTVFLGIFLEALPFLLLGVLASAVIDVFVSDQLLSRFVPRWAIPAAVCGALLGLLLPVCECGVIPVSRRLLSKGAPVPLAIAFMLAGPVINPIVIASTWTAFGDEPLIALGRFALVLVVAVAVALVFGAAPDPGTVLVPPARPKHFHDPHLADGRDAVWSVLRHATVEFFEMARYFVVGGLIATTLQTFVPRAALLGVGQHPALSVLVLMGMAVLLSICSTVDAFVALSFAGTFSSGAILAFLAFGPMVDLKSTLMYTTALRRPAVGLLVLLCGQLIFLIATALNLNLG